MTRTTGKKLQYVTHVTCLPVFCASCHLRNKLAAKQGIYCGDVTFLRQPKDVTLQAQRSKASPG